ncbi:MAG: ribosome maturation factor RimM [Hyphomicrobiaceae bacterium]
MTTPNRTAQRRILLGHISDAHGIKGEVLLKVHTGTPEAIANYGTLVDYGGREFVIHVVRVTPKGVVARVDGVTGRTAAEALKGTELFTTRENLPDPDNDEFYHADLIGLTAVGPDGVALGTVTSVANHGAGDLIEIVLTGSRQSELIPFAKAFVPEVDLAKGQIVVHLPESSDDADAPADA